MIKNPSEDKLTYFVTMFQEYNSDLMSAYPLFYHAKKLDRKKMRKKLLRQIVYMYHKHYKDELDDILLLDIYLILGKINNDSRFSYFDTEKLRREKFQLLKSIEYTRSQFDSDIYKLLLDGWTYKEIAEKYYFTLNAISYRIQVIEKKLNIKRFH